MNSRKKECNHHSTVWKNKNLTLNEKKFREIISSSKKNQTAHDDTDEKVEWLWTFYTHSFLLYLLQEILDLYFTAINSVIPFDCYSYSTVWKLQKFSLTIFWQKFRESSDFTKEVTNELISRKEKKNEREWISRFSTLCGEYEIFVSLFWKWKIFVKTSLV